MRTMNNKRLLSGLIGIIAASLSLVCGPAHSVQAGHKPQAPVQIVIEPAKTGAVPESVKSGDTVDLIVSAVSQADAESMDISVVIPDGLALITGDSSWSGPVKKGQKKILPITIRILQTGIREIKAELSITINGRKAFSTATRFTPGETVKRKPEEARPVKKDGKGRDVIEYR